jgi:GNAT superfamily N-acetyltransferase
VRSRRLASYPVIDDVARAIFQPTADELRALVGSNTEVIARPDLLLSIRSVPQDPWSSTVYWAHWREAETDERIGEVLEIFRTRGQSFAWLVTARSEPASLGERLESHGFIRELDGRMLMAELPIAGLRISPDVRVEMVVDRAGLRDGLRVDHPDWDDARVGHKLEDRWRRLGKNFWVAVAYLENRPVGTARWSVNRALGVVEFGGAETLTEFRGRGVYSALVAFRTAHAAREGCTLAGIIADVGTSAPILLKRGFKDLGGATFYLWPLDRFRAALGAVALA